MDEGDGWRAAPGMCLNLVGAVHGCCVGIGVRKALCSQKVSPAVAQLVDRRMTVVLCVIA